MAEIKVVPRAFVLFRMGAFFVVLYYVFFEKQENILFYVKFYIQKGIILKMRRKRLVSLLIWKDKGTILGGVCYEGISEKL